MLAVLCLNLTTEGRNPMDETRELVDTITVRQDIGGPYEIYKKVVLQLWSDGSVSWSSVSIRDEITHTSPTNQQ
jgi:hypothetical protein